MPFDALIYRPAGATRRRILILLFCAWFVFVVFQSWTHLLWRDEVRAFSLALRGGSLLGMLKALHGEGHPAIWYILLRVAHDLVPRPEILLWVSVAVATAAILILLWRSPFSLPVVSLILFSNFSTFEYSVMARNYGISMLLLFLFAALYERHRDRGIVLGVLLLLIANCNAIADVAVCGILLLWFVDVLASAPELRATQMRVFFRNAAISVIGMLLAFATVYPAVNDDAVNDRSALSPQTVSNAILLPGRQFGMLSGLPHTDRLVKSIPSAEEPIWILQSVLLFGSTLGLIRRPGAFLAGLITLIVLSLFFTIVYPGDYRHQAVWIILMIGLYWIAHTGGAQQRFLPNWLESHANRLACAGTVMFILLLVVQLPYSASRFVRAVANPAALIRARANHIGSILARRPDLAQATLLADPDYLLETAPYYVSNPVWLTRERKYAPVVTFTKDARRHLDLGELLAEARRIRAENGRPVVILLSRRPDTPAQYREGYRWTFTVNPKDIRDFNDSAVFLAHRTAPPWSDETYDAWVLK